MILLFFLAIFLANGQNKGSQLPDVAKGSVSEQQAGFSYTYAVIPSLNGTWGYDILKGSKKVIHQESIPGLPGNEGFSSRGDAEKVARLVIEKLLSGEMPPSVTLTEMKSLKVL
jgi:hypothetical protein